MSMINQQTKDAFTVRKGLPNTKTQKTVLIADDESDILYALQLLLISEGYRVFACNNGREAWSVIQDQSPDLVLTDIMMPYMTGLELLNKIRSSQRTQDIPVVLMSCIKPAEIQCRDERNSYISKPFKLDQLLSLIEAKSGAAYTEHHPSSQN